MLLAGSSCAEISIKTNTDSDKWGGIWYSSSPADGALSITVKDGWIDISGKDIASIFTCTGIVSENSVMCFGSGINLTVNLRFIYKNKLIYNGHQLDEEWECLFANGQKVQGKTTFQRKETSEVKIEELKKFQNNATKPGSGSSSSAPSDTQAGTWTDPVTGMVFVWVPEGCYQMGCGSWTSNCYDDESPVHEVCVDGFWMGQTEVTQGQWQRVMGDNPSNFKKGDNYPVEQVSWDDAKEYIRKLNSMGSAKFRLPSEAEWEYAARSGGKAEKYSGGGDVDSLAWHNSNSGSSTHPVKTKKGNGLGIYDMSGNRALRLPERQRPFQPGPHRWLSPPGGALAFTFLPFLGFYLVGSRGRQPPYAGKN
jgi:hypothetical protein